MLSGIQIDILSSCLFAFTMGWYFIHAGKKKPNKLKVLLWGILSILIIVLWVAVRSLQEKSQKAIDLKTSKDSLAVLDDSIKKLHYSMALAETSKIQSKKNLELAEKYFNSKIKPLLFIDNFKLDTLLPGKSLTISYTVQNIGGTSAKRYRIFASTLTYVDESNLNFPLELSDNNLGATIPPTKALKVTYATIRPLPTSIFDLLKSKKLYLYFFGTAYYYDDFGKLDSTGFAVIANPELETGFTLANSHNF